MWRVFVETVQTEPIEVPEDVRAKAWMMYEKNVDKRKGTINGKRSEVDECIVRAAKECCAVVAYMASKDKNSEMKITPGLYEFVCTRISEEVGPNGIVC